MTTEVDTANTGRQLAETFEAAKLQASKSIGYGIGYDGFMLVEMAEFYAWLIGQGKLITPTECRCRMIRLAKGMKV